VKQKSPKYVEIYKALKTVLAINYRYRMLDIAVSPTQLEILFAVQFIKDPEKNWHPRLVVYYPRAGRVAIRARIQDPEPTWVAAETIIAMAELKAKDEKQPKF